MFMEACCAGRLGWQAGLGRAGGTSWPCTCAQLLAAHPGAPPQLADVHTHARTQVVRDMDEALAKMQHHAEHFPKVDEDLELDYMQGR